MREAAIAARLLAAMESLGDETPLMQVTESEEPWGGTEVGTQESGLTVGDLRVLCRAVADEEADASDGRIIVSYDRWRALTSAAREVATALCTWPAMHETDEALAVFLRHQAGRLRGETPSTVSAGQRDAYRAELERVAAECGHPELWQSAAEVVRGKLMHYEELEAERDSTNVALLVARDAVRDLNYAVSNLELRHRSQKQSTTIREGFERVIAAIDAARSVTTEDPRSNGTTIGHAPDVLPQGMTFHAGELGDAYVAGAKDGRNNWPTDETIARGADAYVKLIHLRRMEEAAARSATPTNGDAHFARIMDALETAQTDPENPNG